MRQVGKKTQQWLDARVQIYAQAVKDERLTVQDGIYMGFCEDCGMWKPLTPDHRCKRSQGGEDTYENIDWVCIPCHDARDNKGDPMNKKTDKEGNKTKSKKADFMKPRVCKFCKAHNPGMAQCPTCKKWDV